MANIEVTAVDVAPGNVITIQLPGAPGPRGLPNVLTIGTVTTGAAGSNAGVTISGVAPNQVLNFTIPQGIQGIQGVKGDPNTLTIGTVNTVAFPATASATITGTAPNQILNLTLPRGPGVPAGGAANAVLSKLSATDNDTVWSVPASAATASALMIRDSAGRAQIASPSVGSDIANKTYVDTQDSAMRRPSFIGTVGPNYTLQLTDERKMLQINSAMTITVPANATVAFPVGTVIDFIQWSTAVGTFAPASGVSLLAPDGALTTRTQYSTVRLQKTGTDQWILSEDTNSATSQAVSASTSAATGSTIVKRDAAGRAQVVDPSASADIATKNYVDNTAGDAGSPTANTLVRRTASGDIYANIVAPQVALRLKSTTTPGAPANQTSQLLWMDSADNNIKVNDYLGGVRTLSTTSYVDNAVSPNTTKLNAATSAPTASTLMMRDTSGGFSAATGTFSGTVTSGGQPLVRHWGQGAVFPTVGLIAGDRFIHTLYASVVGASAGSGVNSYHAYTEFVWNGYSWRQTHVTTVESPADRRAMTSALIAAGASAYTQPDIVGTPNAYPIHDGFEVMETSGNRRYQWMGSAWQLTFDPNHSVRYNTEQVTAATGWTATSAYVKQGPYGTAYFDLTFTRSGAAITVPTDGNITNQLVATLNSRWNPSQGLTLVNGSTSAPLVTAILGSDGTITLAAVAPGTVLGTNFVFGVTANYYPVNDPIALIDYTVG